MKVKILVLSVVIMTIIAASVAAPVYAGSKYQTFSGLECVYLKTEGTPVPTEEGVRILGQVNQNVFYSDDPQVFPDAVHDVVLDIIVDMESGVVNWKGRGTIETEGMGIWRSKGVGHIDLVSGSSHGKGVYHGTGDYHGMTTWVDLTPGDISRCPGVPFDATHWSGFVVPSSE
jgi:hypothetical protein